MRDQLSRATRVRRHYLGRVPWPRAEVGRCQRGLKQLDVGFEEQNIEDAGYQVFIYDPVGTKLEFNFQGEHVPDAVPLGTTTATVAAYQAQAA